MPIYHIPTDEEAGSTIDNLAKRVFFMCTCAICKKDYEIREGKWLPTFTKKGTEIHLKVCNECYEDETNFENTST